MKMRYLIKPTDRIYVKGYGFLSFSKNIGKNVSSKYRKKLLESAAKSTTDAIKTASERAIQKTAEAAGDLIGNKIADDITIASSQNSLNTVKAENMELNKEIPKEKYISPEKHSKLLLN